MKCFSLSIRFQIFQFCTIPHLTLFSHSSFTISPSSFTVFSPFLGVTSITTPSLLLVSLISSATKLNHVSSGRLMLMHSLVCCKCNYCIISKRNTHWFFTLITCGNRLPQFLICFWQIWARVQFGCQFTIQC